MAGSVVFEKMILPTIYLFLTITQGNSIQKMKTNQQFASHVVHLFRFDLFCLSTPKGPTSPQAGTLNPPENPRKKTTKEGQLPSQKGYPFENLRKYHSKTQKTTTPLNLKSSPGAFQRPKLIQGVPCRLR